MSFPTQTPGPAALRTPLGSSLTAALESMLPASVPNAHTLAAEEELLCTIATPPSQPILLVNDCSASPRSILFGLANRGLVTVRNKTAELTDLGKKTKIVFGGDMNDRSNGFLEIVHLEAWLQSNQAKIEKIFGNHELYFIAALMHDHPKTIPDELLDYVDLQVTAHPNHRVSIVGPDETVSKGIYTWIERNGGEETVVSLAGWYRTHYPSCNETPEETKRLDRLKGTFLNLESACLAPSGFRELFRDACRAARMPAVCSYMSGHRCFYRDGSILFTHGFLPSGVNDSYNLATLDTDVMTMLSKPDGPWMAGFSFRWELTPRRRVAPQVYGFFGPGWELFRERFPEKYDDPADRQQKLNRLCPQSLIDYLKSQGINEIARGHDPAFQFGETRQTVEKGISEIKILHCDTESASSGKDPTSYTYFSPKGEVFIHFNPRKKVGVGKSVGTS